MTHFALDINVRQKVHFDFDQPAALAVFAATTFDIEAETPRVITTHACGWKLREQFANRCEGTAVCDWIRSRRAPNRTLINDNGLVDLIDPTQNTKRPRLFLRIVEMTEQRSAQNIVYQSRFAAAGHTGHTNETPERKRRSDILEIIFARPNNRYPAFGKLVDSCSAFASHRCDEWLMIDRTRRNALTGDGNSGATGKVIGSNRIFYA